MERGLGKERCNMDRGGTMGHGRRKGRRSFCGGREVDLLKKGTVQRQRRKDRLTGEGTHARGE